MFPAEMVPDGALFAPHHYLLGTFVALFVFALLWDNYRNDEPTTTVGLTIVSLFGWAFTWKYYPTLGASMAIVGTFGATFVLLWDGFIAPRFRFPSPFGDRWEDYPLKWRVVGLVGSLIAVDDLLSHAFGLWTPLDAVWPYIVPYIT